MDDFMDERHGGRPVPLPRGNDRFCPVCGQDLQAKGGNAVHSGRREKIFNEWVFAKLDFHIVEPSTTLCDGCFAEMFRRTTEAALLRLRRMGDGQ